MYMSRQPGSPRRWTRLGPSRPVQERLPSLWWAALAVPLLVAGALFWWWADLSPKTPDELTDVTASATLVLLAISVGCFGTALVVVEAVLLMRWHARDSMARSASYPGPAGWYLDPIGRAPSRWWDGFNWTGPLNQRATRGSKSPVSLNLAPGPPPDNPGTPDEHAPKP